MGFVTVRDKGEEHYDWHIRPGGGRPFDVLSVLVDFVDDGEFTVDGSDVLGALEDRIETDWGDTNLSPYLNTDSDALDLRTAGALNKVKTVGNQSRRPLQLDAAMVRTLAPGYYEHATSDDVRRRICYLGGGREPERYATIHRSPGRRPIRRPAPSGGGACSRASAASSGRPRPGARARIGRRRA